MKKMTPKTIDMLREEIEFILKEPLKNLGYKVEFGNATYDDDSVKFTGFRVSSLDALNEDQKALARELEWRESQSWVLSLDKDRVATINRMDFKLYGYKPRRKKNPFLIERTDGSAIHMCSEDIAEKFFGIKGTDVRDGQTGTLTLTDIKGEKIS